MIDNIPQGEKCNSEYICFRFERAIEMMKSQTKTRHQQLIYNLSDTTNLICKSLFLSNNEVNVIIYSYLNMWSNDPQYDYVDRKAIESCFESENRGFITSFFKNEQVSCDDYVLFICFFLFYDNKDILTILLSMIGVQSNIFISNIQVSQFIRTYSLNLNNSQEEEYIFKLISEQLFSECQSDQCSLKSFQSFMMKDKLFILRLTGLRQDISHLTLNFEDIDKIIIRNYYYYERISNKMIEDEENTRIKISKESCICKINRIIFTSKPDPFYCDFCLTSDIDNVRIDVIGKIKSKFCLRRRSTSTCFTTSCRSKSLGSRKVTENRIILPVSSSSTFSRTIPSKEYSTSNKNKIFPSLSDS